MLTSTGRDDKEEVAEEEPSASPRPTQHSDNYSTRSPRVGVIDFFPCAFIVDEFRRRLEFCTCPTQIYFEGFRVPASQQRD